MVTLSAALAFFPNYASAQALDANCRTLTSSYSSSGMSMLDGAIRDVNTTNIAPADFVDTVACECRLNLKQTVREVVSKAIAATNAGLWAAEPMHHDLTAQENLAHIGDRQNKIKPSNSKRWAQSAKFP
jgi:hypothetical protein